MADSVLAVNGSGTGGAAVRRHRHRRRDGSAMVLRRGDRGIPVAGIRVTLASLGFLPPEPRIDPEDVVFDDATDGAVRAFQQRRGLLVDGLVGPATQRALDDARWTLGDRTLSFTLSARMTGDDVIALQTRLLEMGYDTGRPDGMFGPATDRSVREYQRNRGLSDDGVFGPETYRDLARIGRMVTGGRPVYLREHNVVRQAGPRLRGKRIVIDPAHGAADPGWTVGGVRGADLCYDVARRLEGRMAATGMATYLTRGAHQNPSAEERAQVANDLNADLLISIHVDGSASTLASGIATFHFGTDSGHTSTMGERLAELIQRELVARTGLIDCRVHHRPWDLLRMTKMPAVQIELGYLSNPTDRDNLLREEFRNTVADGILVAVKRLYLDGRDEPSTGTFTFSELLAYEQQVRGV